MKTNSGKIILGLSLILLGTLFLLDQTELNSFLGYRTFVGFFWPTVIIASGIVFLIRGDLTPGIIFVTLGLLFFGSHVFGWHIWNNWWPILIIASGVAILLGKITHQPLPNPVSGTATSSTLNDFVFLGGTHKQIVSQDFAGGKITCMFGGGKIDLRQAGISKDGAKLDVFCAFGGAEIIVPPEMNVEVIGNGFLGAVENKTIADPSTKDKPKLLIAGSAAFGGIEIKN